MNITVNGKANQVDSGTSIVMLLSQYKINSPMTIVEVNGTVIPKDEWESHAVQENDQIEIIQLMGGG
ncbi:MAG: sulfur carrier protein ThiS [Deltaproteobacteria bacterium]|nr:sulfur carrier protein ThiS [Deltaproteobacteria bacterium]